MPSTCCVLGLNGVNQDCAKKALWEKQEAMKSREHACVLKSITLCDTVLASEG